MKRTKLDTYFLTAQFWIPGCHKPFQLDVTANSGGLLENSEPTNYFLILKLYLLKQTWRRKSSSLVEYINNYHRKVNIASVLLELRKFFEDFNKWLWLYKFGERHTCFKKDGSWIDLILTNRKYLFKFCTTFETRLSDHHIVSYTQCLRQHFRKTNQERSYTVILENLLIQILNLS